MPNRYFSVMTGLRGCYMPDNAYTFKATSRRELRSWIDEEAKSQSCDGAFVGLSQAAVSWAANNAWKGASQTILPFGKRGELSKPFSIEIVKATRAEWLEYEENQS